MRPYESKPPVRADGDVDPMKYPLRLVKLEYDANSALKGWSRIKLSIPPATRARYLEDPIYGQSWKQILNDFDKTPIGSIVICFWLGMG